MVSLNIGIGNVLKGPYHDECPKLTDTRMSHQP